MLIVFQCAIGCFYKTYDNKLKKACEISHKLFS